MLNRLWHVFDPLFPEQEIYIRRFSLKTNIALFVILTAIFGLLISLVPENDFVGFDWTHFWGKERVPPFYPPWTLYAIRYLTYPLLSGITLAAFSLATFKRAVHPISAVAAFLSLPLLWTVFLGQLEGLVLLGLLGLPWLVPLVMIKPQIAVFALGVRRSSIIGFIIVLIISFIVWGNWPADMLAVNSFFGEGRFEQNIALGLWGLPFFLLTVWFSRGDMDMLMASGAFISPYMIFYSLLPLTPALARLTPRAAILALIFSYLTFSSNWLGPIGWWFGWLFVPWIWVNLAAIRYPEAKASQLLQKIVGSR